MPGAVHSWLYLRDRMGMSYELINGARTAAYLSDPDLAIPGIMPCQEFLAGACETYPYTPYLGPDIPGHISIPAVNGNYLSVTDAAALDIVGDITILANVQPLLWTGSTQTIVGKWSTASNLSYMLQIDTAGKLLFSWTSNGTTVNTALSTVAIPGTVANVARHVGVTFDVNNGASGRTARFWYSTDGNNWTLFNTVTSATATSLFSGSSPLLIGTQTASTNRFTGKIHSVSVRNGMGTAGIVGGTEVFKLSGFEWTNAAATSTVATTGQTVTVVRAGSPQLVITEAVDCSTWTGLTFDTPEEDAAPWYNENYPQSADALGFFIEEWTGLDDAHVSRPSTPWGGYGGGSSLRAITASGRTIKVNLFLFGRTEEATEYLFRWLAATLTGVCSSCATESIMIRRFCGSVDDLWDGVAEMRNVGLIEGLRWEAEPVTGGSCSFRRASFTLMAGDPCMYLPDEPVPAAGSDATPADLSACFAVSIPNPERANCRPECAEVKSACRLTRAFDVNPMAAMAPIVTWTNSMSQYSFPFRAICYADPALVGPSNPCGLPILGEIYVRPLPPDSAFRWDVVGRKFEYMDASTGGWVGGAPYVEANDNPIKRFFALPCGTGYVVMEPSSLCATFVTGTTWTLDGITYNPPSYPSVSVSMGERISCA